MNVETKRVAIGAVALLLSAMAGCRDKAVGVQGNGVQTTQPREVGPFDRIEIDGNIRLNVVTGPFDTPTLSGEENLLPLVTTSVVGTKLNVHQTDTLIAKHPIKLTLHAPALVRIDSNGAGAVSVTGLKGPSFTFNSSGATEAMLSGQVDRVDITTSGAARVFASDLVTKEANVGVTGAGDVVVNTTDKLKASVTGAGAVHYRGKPTVEQRISGAGRVAPIVIGAARAAPPRSE